LTRHPEFAHLKLSELRGRYKWTGTRLEVADLRLEEKKLFRVESAFVIDDKQIEGTFQLGATADVLDSIPGAREKEQLAKGFLAPLLKPGKGLLELLKTIYP